MGRFRARAAGGAGLSFIPAPKTKLPGHEASYNPPKEYLPTEVRPPFARTLPFPSSRHSPRSNHVSQSASSARTATPTTRVPGAQEEKQSYQLMEDEDRPDFVPSAFESLRQVRVRSHHAAQLPMQGVSPGQRQL